MSNTISGAASHAQRLCAIILAVMMSFAMLAGIPAYAAAETAEADGSSSTTNETAGKRAGTGSAEGTPASAATSVTYDIYPQPHDISYADGAIQIPAQVQLLIEPGIDEDTARRLDEALAMQGSIGITEKSGAWDPKAPFTLEVGVRGSKGVADKALDQLIAEKKITVREGLFDQTDSYLLAFIPGSNVEETSDAEGTSDAAGARILLIGKDTDAAFYGATTLYRILEQASARGDSAAGSSEDPTSADTDAEDADTADAHRSAAVRELVVQDWADVATRGFIEGYYGNPWSTQNRIELMRWGGYYKLNAYIYAPKDDPKHNANWREMYTSEEIATKIQPLAEAGNESKVRFVYALHPFMHAQNQITAANYDQTVPILKNKFRQVIDAGVRQIAILADDISSGVHEQATHLRLMRDMTAWIQELQKETNPDGSLKYPGLKDTIIFCPENYMGQGEAWYGELPETVQVINTGGQVWGAANGDFISRWGANSAGRAMFMWMNYPCSDNDKTALHMGAYEDFLKLNVKPGQLSGLVMNPMQQSEPSKQGIFMNADFTWNLWEDSYDHADQAWLDSFTYIDHGSPFATPASDALRDLSWHLRRMAGGGATWEGQESAAGKEALTALADSVKSGILPSVEQIDAAGEVYAALKPAVAAYRTNPGTPEMARQIEPWLNAFEDLADAADYFLNALESAAEFEQAAAREGADSEQAEQARTELVSNYQNGTAKWQEYQSANTFTYYNSPDQVAQVGKAYLTPTVQAMSSALEPKVKLALNPDAQICTYITSRQDAPAEGNVSHVTDGNETTGVTYKTPNSITTGTYAGLQCAQPFDLDRVVFTLGSGKDFFDEAQLQTRDAQGSWNAVPGKSGLTGTRVDLKNLGLTDIYGVRLIATKDNARDAWFVVKEIALNPVDITVTLSDNIEKYSGSHGDLAQVADGNTTTNPLWIKPKLSDQTPQGAWVHVRYGTAQTISAVVFVQSVGEGNKNDVISSGTLEYQDTEGTWHEIGQVTAEKEQRFTLPQPVEAEAIRVTNNETTSGWWILTELSAVSEQTDADRSKLKATIEQARAKNEADYTAFSWQVLSGQLTSAQAVYDSASASQDDIDNAELLLRAAIDGLKDAAGGGAEPAEPEDPSYEQPLGTDMLERTVRAAKQLASEHYTAESYEPVAEALVRAEALLEAAANVGENSPSQEDIDEALSQLRAAVKELNPASASGADTGGEDIEGEGQGGDGGQGTDAGSDGQGVGNDHPGSSSHKGGAGQKASVSSSPDLSRTGSHMYAYAMMALLGISAGAAALFARRTYAHAYAKQL